MNKFLVFLLVSSVMAVNYAKTLRGMADDDIDSDEMSNDIPDHNVKDKELGLITNEVNPSERAGSLYRTNNVGQTPPEHSRGDGAYVSSAFINPVKPPSSPLAFILEAMYSICSWIWDKIFG